MKYIFLLFILLTASPVSVYAEVTVVDVLGREVVLPKAANKIVLGEGRFIAALGALGIEQPISRIAGMMNEFELYDPDGFAAYKKIYPEIVDVPKYGHTSAESVSIERLLLLDADAALLGIESHGPNAHSKHILDKLEAADIPVIFVDFRRDPVNNTAKSMKAIADLLGEPEKGANFVQWYERKLDFIATTLAQVPEAERPKVMIELRSNGNEECCLSVAKGLFADMIGFAGGRSLASDILLTPVGQISHEQVLSSDFDVYIGTAVGSLASDGFNNDYLVSGVGVTKALAKESLLKLVKMRRISELEAVKKGNAYLLWHHFYNSPLNIYAIEKMATWFYPDLFASLTPDATLEYLLRGSDPVNLSGTYALGLNDEVAQ